MILIDTGPLVALVNRRDSRYAECRAIAALLPDVPMVTTWPCFAEAMHLLSRRAGFAAIEALWRLRSTGQLRIYAPTEDDIRRCIELMTKYRDLPMDLADASLVAAAEQLQLRTLFTLDGDFRIYQLADGSTLDLVP